MSIAAMFENGVFRPMEPVNLPELTRVELDVHMDATAHGKTGGVGEGLRRAYAILGERFASGQTDVAERHNEHQP